MTLRVNRSRKARIHLDGLHHPDFRLVEAALRRQLQSYTGGAAACVYHRGECVVDLWGGYRDEDQNLWCKDTMAPSFSTTKGVCSTLLHIFADRGLIDYDAKVSKYWPEFAQAGKQHHFEQLKGALTGELTADDYARAGEMLGITPAAAKQAAYRMRKRYREMFRQEVARTTACEEDIDDEMRRLFHNLA